jgi:hypothetical protein
VASTVQVTRNGVDTFTFQVGEASGSLLIGTCPIAGGAHDLFSFQLDDAEWWALLQLVCAWGRERCTDLHPNLRRALDAIAGNVAVGASK